MSPASQTGFAGLRVAAFESRMAGPMADLISRHGGVPVLAPALREVPLEHNTEVFEFADRLLAGQFDTVVFMTGVGARFLAEAIESRHPRERWLEALARTRVVARGPKPSSALRGLGARVDCYVPEPNTWHEVLATIVGQGPLEGQRIAVQEYGKPSTELLEALEDRGAFVTRVPVYRWALPEDLGPLEQAIAQIAGGEVAVALFTSAQQVEHLLEVAQAVGQAGALRQALERSVVVGSIGPTTSEALRAHGLAVDIEPEHPKMGHLVAEAASGWQAHREANETATVLLLSGTSDATPHVGRPAAARDRLHDSLFLKACRREPTETTPIWLMRQAGRYMHEYRAVRAKVPFLELCKRPELAAEVTVTAAEKLGVDAAILFADILLILEPLGFDLEFAKGEGPVIHNPLRLAGDVDRVQRMPDAAPLDYVAESVRTIRRALDPGLPLIGFAGGPFTLACYAIEGGSSRHYDLAKAFLYADQGAWSALMERLVEATAVYLTAQAHAGAQALQVFDSWVGTLGPDDYRTYVLPHMRALFAQLPPEVPVIHFGTDTAALLELQREAGGQVIGLDWRVDLAEAWQRLGPGQVAVQGNLDPAVLLGPRPLIEARARQVLKSARGRPGHVFNLGHGILPSTPVEHVQALVDLVHSIPTAASATQ